MWSVRAMLGAATCVSPVARTVPVDILRPATGNSGSSNFTAPSRSVSGAPGKRRGRWWQRTSNEGARSGSFGCANVLGRPEGLEGPWAGRIPACPRCHGSAFGRDERRQRGRWSPPRRRRPFSSSSSSGSGFQGQWRIAHPSFARSCVVLIRSRLGFESLPDSSPWV